LREALTLPASREALREISEAVEHAATAAQFDGRELADLQVAVAEACTNVIIHGLQEDVNRSFSIEIESKGNGVEVVVKEDGEPFDFRSAPPPDLDSSLTERRIGGLGLFLIEKLVDSVTYTTESGGVKVATLIKSRKGV
jgi:serine/threonine-protein kinase RsbW